jgi:hypothetical protein
MTKERRQIALHVCQVASVAPDLIAADTIDDPLLDAEKFLSLEILEGEFFAKGEELADDPERISAGAILDHEIAAEGNELLLQ